MASANWRFHGNYFDELENGDFIDKLTIGKLTGDSIGEHWVLPESKIILISIVLLFLLFILWVGEFGNTKKLPKNNVSQ